MNYHKSIKLVICTNQQNFFFFFSKVPKINRDGATIARQSHHTEILEKYNKLSHKIKIFKTKFSRKKVLIQVFKQIFLSLGLQQAQDKINKSVNKKFYIRISKPKFHPQLFGNFWTFAF